MRLLGIDFETTGLDPQKDEITEIGFAIVDTDNWKKPLVLKSILCNTSATISPEIKTLTGISNEMLAECGVDVRGAIIALMASASKYRVDHFVAHNAPFDRAFLEAALDKAKSTSRPLSWIDTKKDIPWSTPIRNTSLITVAAEHGFLNPFPHAALFDVFTMLKVLSLYDINDVIKFRDEPLTIVRALVDYDNKDKAKAKGFSWEKWDDKVFPKSWVRGIKERHLEAEIKKFDFDVKIISG